MIAYTEDKKRHNLNINNFIGEGSYGRVYLTSDNKCLKIFKESISRKDKMSFDEDAFNIIRELKPKNIYTLGDLYYNRTLTRILGYLSEYYAKEDIDILTMPVDYTFDSLCSLYDSFTLLSKYKICVEDVTTLNVILNNNGMTIIDIDSYYKDNKNTEKSILKNNLYALGELFACIYINSLTEVDAGKRVRMADKIERLFMPIGAFGVEPVIKKLIKYKYPIDYLQKR